MVFVRPTCGYYKELLGMTPEQGKRAHNQEEIGRAKSSICLISLNDDISVNRRCR